MFGPIISRDHLWKPGTPAWVPVPLFYCGEFERFEARFFEVSDESFDLARVNEKTARVCASGNPLFDVKSEAEHIAVPVVEAAGELEAEANRLLALLLEDAPALRFDFGSPRRWFLGDQPCWRAVDKSTGAEISIDDLSSAQKRWAQMVMSLKTDAGAARVGHARLILIDEPESALHPRAQRRIVEGLKHLAATESVPVIVATHSPVLLDDSDVRLLHVSRAHDGLAEVSSIESPLKLGADALGVSPSQLVQLYRVILLVEGEHDRAVFEGVLGPEFEEARTLIVPMRGANNLVTIPDSRILFDFTDATLVVALDNAPLEKYRPGWESAVVLAAQGKRMKALFELRRAVAEATPESLKIHEFCQRAIETGRTDRVEIYGLSKKDIIEYLPIQSFLPDAQSWDEVKKEWNDAGGAKELNLKDFLRRKGADVTTERIRETAGQLQELPYEFRELLELCQSKSHLRVVL